MHCQCFDQFPPPQNLGKKREKKMDYGLCSFPWLFAFYCLSNLCSKFYYWKAFDNIQHKFAILFLDVWNGKLQAMMKDPFGNYVVQKVLETCDERSLELILSRIKVHLNTLKTFTFGKHIVSRVEKLITTGGEEFLHFLQARTRKKSILTIILFSLDKRSKGFDFYWN